MVPPSEGTVALNVDGSCYQNRAAVGGVIRDHRGECLGAVAGPVGRGSSLAAEALALHAGLQMLNRGHFSSVQIQSDSKVLVDQIGKKAPAWYLDTVWADIHHTLRSIASPICHIVRECNFVADGLAKWGHSLPTITFFQSSEELPLRIRKLLARDARGWAYFRS